jgi:glycine cleavage system H protein
MSEIPQDLRYASSHEWVRVESDGEVTVGITDHAQAQLGDVVYVELPEVGRTVAAREEFAVVESVKAASDIYAPVAGEVVAVNEALVDTPELLNSGPFSDGWMMRIRLADDAQLADLLDASAYAEVAAEDEA